MELSYWQSRWNKHKTGFHMQIVYPLLPPHWPRLALSKEARILVPLCGKSLDLNWFMEQGHYVIGVEVSELAIRTFLEQHDLLDEATTDSKGDFTIYCTPCGEFWVGDLLKLHPNWIDPIDAVYDKAAIVALREDQRPDYARHMRTLVSPDTPMMIQTFDYPQDEMPGPPFSVPIEEIESYYGDRYTIEVLEKRNRLDDLAKFKQRGLETHLWEYVLLLTPKSAK
jgi:thiopurine S-methyltransferase